MTDVMNVAWRTGEPQGRAIYAVVPGEGDANDELLGIMDSPDVARTTIEVHNMAAAISEAHTRRPPLAPQPESEVGPRGLVAYDRIETSYGHVIVVQDSSAAERPCVWLFIDGSEARNEADSPPGDSSPHLTREQAQRLMWALHDFLEATK